MKPKNTEEPKPEERVIRDSIIAGLARAVKKQYSDLELEVTPQHDAETRQVNYLLRGTVDEVLQKISENALVGSRDALEAIKNMRSAIFLFKQGG